VDLAVVQQRELTDDLARADLDLAIVDGQDRRPLLDEEHPGPHEARLDQHVAGGSLELLHEGGDRAQMVLVEVGEQRNRAKAVGEGRIHGAECSPRDPSARDLRKRERAVRRTRTRAILVTGAACGATRRLCVRGGPRPTSLFRGTVTSDDDRDGA
jgi:hypothetical protein